MIYSSPKVPFLFFHLSGKSFMSEKALLQIGVKLCMAEYGIHY